MPRGQIKGHYESLSDRRKAGENFIEVSEINNKNGKGTQ